MRSTLKYKLPLIKTHRQNFDEKNNDQCYEQVLSKFFYKKSVVIVCGGDVAYMPEINYSDMRFLKCRTSAKIALTFADILPPVSKFTYFEALNYLKTRYIKVIYHGLDTDLFKPYGMKKDNKLIITAGAINRTTILRKGLETFVGCAKYLPDMKFVLHIVINI